MLSVDEINKLQEENERLKAEVETWKYQTQKSDEMSDEDYRNAKRYKTCLQEIKEIVKDWRNNDWSCFKCRKNMDEKLDEILQKIAECEVE